MNTTIRELKGSKVAAYAKGQRINGPCLITKGMVKIEGGTAIIAILSTGDLVGLDAILGIERDIMATAIGPVEGITAPVNDLRYLSEVSMTFTHYLAAQAMKRALAAENRVSDMVGLDARGRIIAFLKQMAIISGRKCGQETAITHGLTHEEFAQVTGCSRQLVTTVLGDLRREGAINMGRGEVLVRDIKTIR